MESGRRPSFPWKRCLKGSITHSKAIQVRGAARETLKSVLTSKLQTDAVLEAKRAKSSRKGRDGCCPKSGGSGHGRRFLSEELRGVFQKNATQILAAADRPTASASRTRHPLQAIATSLESNCCYWNSGTLDLEEYQETSDVLRREDATRRRAPRAMDLMLLLLQRSRWAAGQLQRKMKADNWLGQRQYLQKRALDEFGLCRRPWSLFSFLI